MDSLPSPAKKAKITPKSDQKHNQESTLSTILPHEIMLQILSHLPITSLSKLRSLSKSYNSLHTDHVFITLHKNNNPSSQPTNPPKEKIIFRGDYTLYTLDHQDPKNNMVELTFPIPNIVSTTRIRGSCNGILLIRILMSSLLYLWNPCTREYIEVESCFNESRGTYSYSVYGFGYNHVIDDYEIIRVTSQQDLFRSEVAVYSLRKSSWRKAEDTPYKFQGDKMGAYVNDCLHWIAFSDEKKYDCSLLVAFVVGGEKFRDIRIPYSDVGGDRYETSVTSFKKQLCLIHCCCSSGVPKFDIWVMQEYGVWESWTRVFTIQVMTSSKYISDSVLCGMENGGVLVKKDGKNLYFCDPKKGNRRLTMLDDRRIVEASTYMESNVSFKNLLNGCELVSGVGNGKMLETLHECNYDFDDCDLISDAGDEEMEEGDFLEVSSKIDFSSDSVVEPETVLINSCNDEKWLSTGGQLVITEGNEEMAQSVDKLPKEKRTGWMERFTALLKEEEKKKQRWLLCRRH